MGALESTIDGLRRPEYTGENRCYPCTAVNMTIALVVAVGVVWLVAGSQWSRFAYPAGVAVFLLACVPILLRGYLVPGTPTLTKRYFPPWVLVLFGKEPAATGLAGDHEDDGEAIERRLLTAGALEPRPDGEDLQLTPAMSEEWRAEIERVRDTDTDRQRLAEVLGADENELSFATYGDSFRAVMNNRPVGTWESRAAFVADVAAAPLLAERVDGWETIDVPERGRLLNGLRLFLESCPSCDGPLSFGTNTVESCCSEHEVAALTCDDCEARVFESEPL